MNPSHFILNSDYPMEKIVYFAEFEGDVPARHYPTDPIFSKEIVVPGMKTPPLVFGIYATQQDFSDSMPMAGGNDPAGLISIRADHPQFEIGAMPYNDGNDTMIAIYQEERSYSDATKCYFRIYGLAPMHTVESFEPTQRSSGSFLINTDNDYLPLIFSAELSLSWDGINKTVDVQYGYKELVTEIDEVNKLAVSYPSGSFPVVKIWMEDPYESGSTLDWVNLQFSFGNPIPNSNIAAIDEENHTITFDLTNISFYSSRKIYVRVWCL